MEVWILKPNIPHGLSNKKHFDEVLTEKDFIKLDLTPSWRGRENPYLDVDARHDEWETIYAAALSDLIKEIKGEK